MTLVFRVMRPIDRITLSHMSEHTFVNRQFMECSRGHSVKETLYTTMITRHISRDHRDHKHFAAAINNRFEILWTLFYPEMGLWTIYQRKR